VLKILGVPWRASASLTASIQKAAFNVIDTRQDSTRRVNQSSTAARYMKPRAIHCPGSPRSQRHAAVARKIHLSHLFSFPEPPLVTGAPPDHDDLDEEPTRIARPLG